MTPPGYKSDYLYFALIRPAYGKRLIDIRTRPTVRYYGNEGTESVPCITINFSDDRRRKNGFYSDSIYGVWVSYGRLFRRNDLATDKLLSASGYLYLTKGKRYGKRR